MEQKLCSISSEVTTILITYVIWVVNVKDSSIDLN
jgi:hypothetical protein